MTEIKEAKKWNYKCSSSKDNGNGNEPINQPRKKTTNSRSHGDEE